MYRFRKITKLFDYKSNGKTFIIWFYLLGLFMLYKTHEDRSTAHCTTKGIDYIMWCACKYLQGNDFIFNCADKCILIFFYPLHLTLGFGTSLISYSVASCVCLLKCSKTDRCHSILGHSRNMQCVYNLLNDLKARFE